MHAIEVPFFYSKKNVEVPTDGLVGDHAVFSQGNGGGPSPNAVLAGGFCGWRGILLPWHCGRQSFGLGSPDPTSMEQIGRGLKRLAKAGSICFRLMSKAQYRWARLAEYVASIPVSQAHSEPNGFLNTITFARPGPR
jgi:hypothetical protein